MIINGQNGNAESNFVTPRPMVRPIQIKTEPIDEDEAKEASPATSTSSPSTASEPASIVTVQSSNASNGKRPPPMIVINGLVNNETFPKTPKAAPLSVKLGRPRNSVNKVPEKKEISRSSRTIKKKQETKDTRKLRTAVKKTVEAQRASPRKQKENKAKPKTYKIVSKQRGGDKKPAKPANTQPKPRGRPPTKHLQKVNYKGQKKGKGKS
jgi:hypothetical protein